MLSWIHQSDFDLSQIWLRYTRMGSALGPALGQCRSNGPHFKFSKDSKLVDDHWHTIYTNEITKAIWGVRFSEKHTWLSGLSCWGSTESTAHRHVLTQTSSGCNKYNPAQLLKKKKGYYHWLSVVISHRRSWLCSTLGSEWYKLWTNNINIIL